MFLSQIIDTTGTQRLVARNAGRAAIIVGVTSVVELAEKAIAAGTSIAGMVAQLGEGDTIDLNAALAEGRLLAPVSHANPAQLHLTGTGLTHLGSAAARNAMHQKTQDEENLTDSMKMFKLGLEGGKAEPGKAGVQPEWFYKGNGHALVAPEQPITSPGFALDAGEEPEIAGLYVIGPDATPFRIGFALANEFSDHVTERQNYLYLAHSKLRPAAIGPEILVGELPAHIEGTSRIVRDGETLWESSFVSGEDNMSHTLANLEHHHFKYEIFRKPGDVHVHMFGTATLSFADGISTKDGDVFEISAEPFGLPLRNRLKIEPPDRDNAVVAVSPL